MPLQNKLLTSELSAPSGKAVRDFTPLLAQILVVLFIIGFQTRVSLYSGNTVILPMYISVLSGLSMLFLCRKKIGSRTLKAMGAIFALLIAELFINMAMGGDVLNLTKGVVQLSISIAASIGFALTLHLIPKDKAQRLFFTFWCMFIVLGAIELIPAVRSIYQFITDLIYAGTPRGIYASINRDIEIYGHYRPKVFSSEPSFLAATLSVLSILTLFTASKDKRSRPYLEYCIMAAVSFALVPSVSDFFYIAAASICYFWPQKALTRITVSLAISTLAIAIPIAQLNMPANLFEQHQKSGSFFGRITAGPIAGAQALVRRPIAGYGVGDSEATYPLMADVWANNGGYTRFPWYMGLRASDLMSNGFWWQWIFMGAIGGALFTGLIGLLLRSINVKNVVPIILGTWIIWYAGAAFVDIVSWSVFGILAFPSINSLTKRNPTGRRRRRYEFSPQSSRRVE